MKNIALFSFIFLIFSNLTFGQSSLSYSSISSLSQMISTVDNFNNNIKNNTNFFRHGSSNIDTQDVIGSIYLDEEFKKGKIIDKQKGIVIDAYLRYRIYDDSFEVKTRPSDKETIVMERNNKFDVKLDGKEFTFIYNLPAFINGVNNGYVIIEHQKDDVKLYHRLSQKYIPGAKSMTPMVSDKKARLNNQEDFFVELNEKIVAIEPHKKEAYKAFEDHQKELKTYIKENKLNFKGSSEVQDLKTLINYYAEL